MTDETNNTPTEPTDSNTTPTEGGDNAKETNADPKAGEPTEGGTKTETGAKETQHEISLKLEKDSLLSEDDLTAVTELAKTRGLDQKQSEELLEKFEDGIGSHMERQEAADKAKVEGWKTEAAKEKGYKEDSAAIDQAIEKFGNEDLNKVLKDSGYDHYPPLRNFLKQIGNAMKDDTVVKGNNTTPAGEEKTLGETLFPEMVARAKENAAKMQ